MNDHTAINENKGNLKSFSHAMASETSLKGEKARSLSLLLGALRLSAHVVSRDPYQLPGQLTGRLLDSHEPAIILMLEQICKEVKHPWLRPLTASLTPPGGPLVRTLSGHSGAVWAVAVTPDGRRAVSASLDNTLKVWDLERSEELTTLRGHSDAITAVAVTPDGCRAVSASIDKTLKVWNLESGAELMTLRGHTSSVFGVAVTPDGQRVVSGSNDKTLKVWDLESGVERATLCGHSDTIRAMIVTPDGRKAISASDDKTLKVWDLESSAGAGYPARA